MKIFVLYLEITFIYFIESQKHTTLRYLWRSSSPTLLFMHILFIGLQYPGGFLPLKPVQVPPDGIASLQNVNHCTCAEGALDPTAHVTYKDVKWYQSRIVDTEFPTNNLLNYYLNQHVLIIWSVYVCISSFLLTFKHMTYIWVKLILFHLCRNEE